MEICKGGYYNKYEVVKKPYIEFKKHKAFNDNIVIGLIDKIPVCAVNKKGCLSALIFDKKGNIIGNYIGNANLDPVRVVFSSKLIAMQKAYLHIPSFFYINQSYLERLNKYYKKIIK